MKILFLDVDGVLNRLDRYGMRLETVPAPWMTGSTIVDLNVVALLNHVVPQVPDLKIVVSSTWRSLARDRVQFCAMTHVLERWIHEDWRTPSTISRGLEIKEWLQNHPEVESYAILDDTDDELSTHHERRFIRIPHQTGMTLSDFDRWLKIFGYRLKRDFTIATLGGPAEEPKLIMPDSYIQARMDLLSGEPEPQTAPGWKMPDAFED